METIIEIKIAKINGKNLTPSYFKQIPQKKIIGDDNSLQGKPLVRCEYHYGCAEWQRKRPGSHMHVLWLENGELRHAIEILGDNIRDISPWSDLAEIEQIYI